MELEAQEGRGGHRWWAPGRRRAPRYIDPDSTLSDATLRFHSYLRQVRPSTTKFPIPELRGGNKKTTNMEFDQDNDRAVQESTLLHFYTYNNGWDVVSWAHVSSWLEINSIFTKAQNYRPWRSW